MPIFEDYSKNGELLQLRDEPLTEINFTRYAKVEGKEKAEGYLEGLDDFLHEIGPLCSRDKEYYTHDIYGRLGTLNRPYAIGKEVSKLHANEVHFLSFAKQLLLEINKESITKPTQEPVEPRKKLLDETDFQQYLMANGMQKTQGYLDAVEDMTKQIGAYFKRSFKGQIVDNLIPSIGTQTTHLYKERMLFLMYAKPTLGLVG